jgi:hypothetical protein
MLISIIDQKGMLVIIFHYVSILTILSDIGSLISVNDK